jgi:hypothetical protein
MSMEIIKCTCRSPFQDERLGQGKRYANTMSGKKRGNGEARCTVCGSKALTLKAESAAKKHAQDLAEAKKKDEKKKKA